MRRRLLVPLTVALPLITFLCTCNSGITFNPYALCGNGVINPPEQCDDGDKNSDVGACLTTCTIAYCGDGFIYAGKEQCDTNNFGYPVPADPQTCKKLGFDGGTLRCTKDCQLDTSGCGPAFTPGATALATSTPPSTSTPTPPTNCGDGLLENGETCAQCPADCIVHPCTPNGSQATYTVKFAPPEGQDAASVSLLVGYRSNVLSIPGSGFGSCLGNSDVACTKDADCADGHCLRPRTSIKNTPPSSIVSVNDLNYAVRVVVTRSTIPAGPIFTVDFDTCAGAPPASAADVSCSVEGCATGFGPLDGCTCSVSGP